MKTTVTGGNLSNEEIHRYVMYLKEKNPEKIIKELRIHVDGDYVDLSYDYDTQSFERIRRITGYLVGTLDRFNDAKRSEVEDRVKHG